MTTDRQGVNRNANVIRRLDRAIDPPMYEDEPVQSVTVNLVPRGRRTLTAPAGTQESTYQISGSLREFAPGSYGVRAVRVSVGVGGSAHGVSWHLRHSRLGTVDTLNFSAGLGAAGQHVNLLGDQYRPVYAMPAGTISMGFVGLAAANLQVSQNVEAVVSVRRPEDI